MVMQQQQLPKLPALYTPYYEVCDGVVVTTENESKLYKRGILLRSIKEKICAVPGHVKAVLLSWFVKE